MSQPLSQPFAPVIVIAGMHRSGTSLAASIVASAGVHLGERLMGPERGNLKGHFEDLDFFELHQRALAANGLGTEGFTFQDSIEVPPAVDDAFDAIVARRRGLGQPWGWKDPRTTLFLDAWREKLPEARFLLVYRRPWEVVDSLFRRGDAAFAMNPRLAVDVWLAYNRRIRDFFLAHRDHCLLVETTQVAHDPVGMIDAVGRLLGVELARPDDRYDPSLLVEDSSFDRARLVRSMRAEAVGLYESLCELVGEGAASRRGVAAHATDHTHTDHTHTDELIDAAAMQWVRAARAEQLGRRREAVFAATSQLLAATGAERDDLARGLAELKAASSQFAAEREAARSQLDAATREAAVLRDQLDLARRRKTIRERLSIESRRIARQAFALFGLLQQARGPR